jgi:hypothetical protein
MFVYECIALPNKDYYIVPESDAFSAGHDQGDPTEFQIFISYSGSGTAGYVELLGGSQRITSARDVNKRRTKNRLISFQSTDLETQTKKHNLGGRQVGGSQS